MYMVLQRQVFLKNRQPRFIYTKHEKNNKATFKLRLPYYVYSLHNLLSCYNLEGGTKLRHNFWICDNWWQYFCYLHLKNVIYILFTLILYQKKYYIQNKNDLMCTIINTVTVVFLKLLFSYMKCNNESNRICVHDLGTEKWVLPKSCLLYTSRCV